MLVVAVEALAEEARGQVVLAVAVRALLVQMQVVRRAQQTLVAVAAALPKHQAQAALAAQA
jgi:hypothetical protein